MEMLYAIPSMTEFSAEFSVPWTDGDRPRISRGYFATCSVTDATPGTCTRFRSGEDRLSVQWRASELALECALAGLPAGGAAWYADEDPRHMSAANSQRFCHSYMDSLHRNHLPFPPEDNSLPDRERRFLAERAMLLRPGTMRKKKPSAGICGKGLLFLAEHILRSCDGRRLLGCSLCILGCSEAAEEARKQARRMGCELSREGDVLLLFDRDETLPECFPSVVLEADGYGLSACEAAAFSEQNTQICPSVVHGAGLALFEATPAVDDPRQTDLILRHAMEQVGDRVLAEVGDLYHGAYAAAFRAVGDGT